MYCGIKELTKISHGAYSDAEIVYKGIHFNENDLLDNVDARLYNYLEEYKTYEKLVEQGILTKDILEHDNPEYFEYHNYLNNPNNYDEIISDIEQVLMACRHANKDYLKSIDKKAVESYEDGEHNSFYEREGTAFQDACLKLTAKVFDDVEENVFLSASFNDMMNLVIEELNIGEKTASYNFEDFLSEVEYADPHELYNFLCEYNLAANIPYHVYLENKEVYTVYMNTDYDEETLLGIINKAIEKQGISQKYENLYAVIVSPNGDIGHGLITNKGFKGDIDLMYEQFVSQDNEKDEREEQ